jgi:DNA-binding NarL/FixJ family response regulator
MNLLLVDDHPLFAVGFAQALACAGNEVRTASTIDDGLTQALAWPVVDIVLIDYRLGAEDGLTGLRRFGARLPLLARVLISGDEDPALALQARTAGASGFLGKSMSIDALHAALLAIERGEVHFPSSSERPRAAASGVGPTARQLEVLALVARGEPNKRIATKLGIAERTVKLHITALFEVLNARNRTHLLVVAKDKGLI